MAAGSGGTVSHAGTSGKSGAGTAAGAGGEIDESSGGEAGMISAAAGEGGVSSLGGNGGVSGGGLGGGSNSGGQSGSGGSVAVGGSAGSAAICGGANLKTDTLNCGTCGNDCTASANIGHPELVTCKGGTCSVPDAACASGKRHCTSVTTDVCETNITTVVNCGDCGIKCDSTQVCSAGQCLLKDGNPCGTKTDCQSNACTTFYLDADGDGHGTAASAKAVCGTTPPAGYVASKDDCCDVGSDAASIFPGQTAFFTSQTTSCSRGWDYNCDNTAELQYGYLLRTECVPLGECGPANTLMWSGTSIPACGESSTQSLCLGFAAGDTSCATAPQGSFVQGCH